MRLLNTRTLGLEEFVEHDDSNQVPKYAILSHRWEEDEVSYQDLRSGSAAQKRGFSKISRCCSLAMVDGLNYAWIDTCCIDKTSSAELSEAINSMYSWYRNADLCYAFLPDVASEDQLGKSSWFTRGWTLQELIAPPSMKFYGNEGLLGRKRDLKRVLADLTQIPVDVLDGASPKSYSVAQRMSWASKRVTTRPEDQAYSLLGLFDVTMPLLYGEGGKAFSRLQEEIIKHSNDQTLFAWSSEPDTYRGLLAPSPWYFKDASKVRMGSGDFGDEPYAMTNVGLSISLPLTPYSMDTYIAVLNCVDDIVEAERPSDFLCIFLRRMSVDPSSKQFARIRVDCRDIRPLSTTGPVFVEAVPRMVSVSQSVVEQIRSECLSGFRLAELCPNLFKWDEAGGPSNFEVFSRAPWNASRRILKMPRGSQGTCGRFLFLPYLANTMDNLRLGYIELGFDSDFNPYCLLSGVCADTSTRTFTDPRVALDLVQLAGTSTPEAMWRARNYCILKGSRQSGLFEKLKFLNLAIGIREEAFERDKTAMTVYIRSSKVNDVTLPARWFRRDQHVTPWFEDDP